MLKGGYQVFKGITFNGKSSYKDLGLTMNPERTISIPNKRKIKITPAFSNMAIDFSGLYGSQPYDERELVYRFNIGGRKISDKNTMNMVKTKIINWLMGTTGKTKLYDDNIKGYYFLAEVEGNSAFVEDWKMGVLEVTFTAYPFMIAELKEGHDVWDDFNFELDYSQVIKHDVSGSKTITIVNIGSTNIPLNIKTNSGFKLTLNGQSVNYPSSHNGLTPLTLKTGENKVTVEGTGNIEFIFYKELI